ncbi:MAG: hypothetical protein ACREQ9_20115 [Candidatus Binatia bacterium]
MGLFSTSRLRVRFVADRRGRRVVIRGKLSESDRGKLRRLLGSLPIRKGQVDLREDWAGRTRVVFDEEIPERYHQPIRNLLGNLRRL